MFLARLISTGLEGSNCTGGRSAAAFLRLIPVREDLFWALEADLDFIEGDGGVRELLESLENCLDGMMAVSGGVEEESPPIIRAAGLTRMSVEEEGLMASSVGKRVGHSSGIPSSRPKRGVSIGEESSRVSLVLPVWRVPMNGEKSWKRGPLGEKVMSLAWNGEASRAARDNSSSSMFLCRLLNSRIRCDRWLSERVSMRAGLKSEAGLTNGERWTGTKDERLVGREVV